jgi:hypothetical protein
VQYCNLTKRITTCIFSEWLQDSTSPHIPIPTSITHHSFEALHDCGSLVAKRGIQPFCRRDMVSGLWRRKHFSHSRGCGPVAHLSLGMKSHCNCLGLQRAFADTLLHQPSTTFPLVLLFPTLRPRTRPFAWLQPRRSLPYMGN